MRTVKILCIVLTVVLIAPSAFATSNATDFSALDKTIQEELNATHSPGCAVAIVSGDEIVYAKGFGTADIETGVPVTLDTLFRIGSTTKIFTAIALVTLAEQGKVDLNRSLDNYIASLSPKLSKVTASQLMSHTAGLKDEAIPWGPHDDSALNDYVLSINDSMFFAEPGEVYSYANPGFSIAGYLAEKASGKNYADLLDDTIFKPLKMNRTTLRPTTAMTYPLSQGHIADDNGTMKVVRPYTDNVGIWPAGFIFSTANDLSHLAIAMMNNGTFDGKTVISPNVINAMSKPHAFIPSANGSYGYGLKITDFRGFKVVEHSGGLPGFTCTFKIVPENRTALIILNNGGREMLNSTRKAFEMMLPLSPEVVKEPVEMNESEMAKCVGNYSQYPQWPEHIYSVKAEGGKLLVKRNGHVIPIDVNSSNMFVPGKDGKIKYLHLRGGAYPKIES